MIYLKNSFFKCPNQKLYDQLTDRFTKGKHALSKKFVCTCGHIGLHRNGHYKRTLYAGPHGKLCIRVLQLRCPQCGCTHAVFLSSFIPFLQISIGDAVQIMLEYRNGSISGYLQYRMHYSMDEQTVYRLIHRAKKYEQTMLAHLEKPIDYSLPPEELVQICFRILQIQFLQERGRSLLADL